MPKMTDDEKQLDQDYRDAIAKDDRHDEFLVRQALAARGRPADIPAWARRLAADVKDLTD